MAVLHPLHFPFSSTAASVHLGSIGSGFIKNINHEFNNHNCSVGAFSSSSNTSLKNDTTKKTTASNNERLEKLQSHNLIYSRVMIKRIALLFKHRQKRNQGAKGRSKSLQNRSKHHKAKSAPTNSRLHTADTPQHTFCQGALQNSI